MARSPRQGARKSKIRNAAEAEGPRVTAAPVPPPEQPVGRGPGNVIIQSGFGASFEVPDIGAGRDAPLGIGARGNRTVIYVHGIGNKPPESVLKCQWDTALFGHPMGDRSRLAYWVNREYYPAPEDATCATPDHTRVDDDEVSTRAIMALSRGERGDEEAAVEREIEALSGGDPDRKRMLEAIAGKMLEHAGTKAPSGSFSTRVLPFEWLRRFIAPKLTRAFLRDVHDFLYVPERRAEMEQSLADRIAAGGGPFIVIGHSQGSLIAYDVLRRLDAERCPVELFVTIGSPLGIAEVQDELRDWGGGSLDFPQCVRRWVNVSDPDDIVAIDADLNGEFEGKRIEDLKTPNLDGPDHPHSGTGYLRTEDVRRVVREATGTAFRQVMAPFVIAGDLVERIENAPRKERHPVLIQLASNELPDEAADLDATAAKIEAKIQDMLRLQGLDGDCAKVDRMRRYVAAKLTRLEIETLRACFRELRIEGLWRNSQKRAFIAASTHTVQARPGNLGYGADGRKITWAVLDTGIRGDHPHFGTYGNVVAQWDCTKRGEAPRRLERSDRTFRELDKNGHGTHVAEIIAGRLEVDDPRDGRSIYAGMAPRCRLLGFKVLDDEGDGEDAWIIKALDIVASLNERAGEMIVHGVNLSLGGNFDPSVFGTGHTPLCNELRRLWNQGVLVCLAAGNEGFTMLRGQNSLIQANMDITIGDPANLDEAIAVGSVHKTNPHTYGVSYFSSRGPTADGRRKPDVVAPGERIISARHDWVPHGGGRDDLPSRDDLYVEMSGTSMAAPHVSGLLAAFLSLRREFIGYPDRVKRILLDGCVDLARDPYMQGAGLPNLIKMLALN